MADFTPDDLTEAAALLGYVVSGRRPEGVEPGVLTPGPNPAADDRIDEWLWRASLTLWQDGVMCDGPPSETAQEESRHLIALACAAWRASGRDFTEFLETGLHPAQRIALERFEIIAGRAARTEPLCPELLRFG